MTRFAGLFALGSALLLLSAPGIAHADSIDTFANTPANHTGGECCFQVVLDQVDSKDIKVTVTLIDGATFFAGTGSGQHPGFALDLSGDPAITVTGFDSTKWTYSSTNVTTGGPSLGTFDNQFNLKSGGTSGSVSSLSFNIFDSAGITFADFIANTDGNYFVADILGNNGKTGLSGIKTPGTVTVTPEPSSLMLLGTGIMGAGLLLRRRMALAAVRP